MKTGTRPPVELLIADTCVLLDLAQADGLGFVSDLITSGLAKIYVAQAVLNELTRGLSPDEVLALGVRVVTPTFSEAFEVKELEREEPRLAYADRMLHVLAKNHGFTIWTNDARLREVSQRRGTAASWCFTEIVKLADLGVRTVDEIIALAATIEKFNPHQVGLEERVRGRLCPR